MENAQGQRWCEANKVSFKRKAPDSDVLTFEPWVHPAYKKSSELPQPIGQQVAQIPMDKFLTRYFENRRYPMPEKAAVVAPVMVSPDAKP